MVSKQPLTASGVDDDDDDDNDDDRHLVERQTSLEKPWSWRILWQSLCRMTNNRKHRRRRRDG